MDTSTADTATKVSIVVSKGSPADVYPALIMADGARAGGLDADLFFTVSGLDAVTRGRFRHLRLVADGDSRCEPPTIPELLARIGGTGGGIYACQASVTLFGLAADDLVSEVQGIITVGEFYARAAGGRIVYT